MKTQCPHCNQSYEVDDYFANKIVQCPQCQKTFPVLPLLVPIPAQEEKQTKEPPEKTSLSVLFILKIICFIIGLWFLFQGLAIFVLWVAGFYKETGIGLEIIFYIVIPLLIAPPFLVYPFVKIRWRR